jgi:ABC-type uncharacterized transport system substrate-binding protein
MKKIALALTMVLFALAFYTNARSAEQVKIEVLFMNHGPLMDTISKMKKVFSSYGNKISVSWYDFETREGEQFMDKKGIHQHVPLIIWINGTSTWTVENKEVTFSGFPTGSGPVFFQGKWTIDSLKKTLDQRMTKK